MATRRPAGDWLSTYRSPSGSYLVWVTVETLRLGSVSDDDTWKTTHRNCAAACSQSYRVTVSRTHVGGDF